MLVKILACNKEFYILRSSLEVSLYFKNLLAYNEKNNICIGDSECVYLVVDFDPNIFSYVIEFLKYYKPVTKWNAYKFKKELTSEEKTELTFLADYLMCQPLVKLIEEIKKPQKLEITIYVNEDEYTLDSTDQEYVTQKLSQKYETYYYNKYRDKIGSDFIKGTYFKKSVWPSTEYREHSAWLNTVQSLQKDLDLGISQIKIAKTSNSLWIYVTLFGSDTLDFPCGFKYLTTPFNEFMDKVSKENLKPAITIFYLTNSAKVIYSDFSAYEIPLLNKSNC